MRNSTSLTSVKSQLFKNSLFVGPFFIKNLNMIAYSVEKHSFVVLNIKLQVQIRKRFIDF